MSWCYFWGKGQSHKMELFDTKTFNCDSALYAESGAVIKTHQHHDNGSIVLKGGTGTINSDNGTLVV